MWDRITRLRPLPPTHLSFLFCIYSSDFRILSLFRYSVGVSPVTSLNTDRKYPTLQYALSAHLIKIQLFRNMCPHVSQYFINLFFSAVLVVAALVSKLKPFRIRLNFHKCHL